jgi:hypothetical protein
MNMVQEKETKGICMQDELQKERAAHAATTGRHSSSSLWLARKPEMLAAMREPFSMSNKYESYSPQLPGRRML